MTPATKFFLCCFSRGLWLALVLTLVSAMTGCGLAERVERGTLEGHVTIAPAATNGAPVSAVTPASDLYAGRSIIIYRSDGATLVRNVLLDSQGNFSTNLEPGQYVVKWRRHGIEKAANLPATVTVESNTSSRLDIQVVEGVE